MQYNTYHFFLPLKSLSTLKCASFDFVSLSSVVHGSRSARRGPLYRMNNARPIRSESFNTGCGPCPEQICVREAEEGDFASHSTVRCKIGFTFCGSERSLRTDHIIITSAVNS
jgi:hypothetical protein